jgi:UDP-N-acetylmuramoyl-L-alanyl-D-glutamate--2,6-diaminopimelate ligase
MGSIWGLRDLLAAAGLDRCRYVPNVWISHLTEDSRQVQPGSLFVAVRGEKVDGHEFISKALEAGARAVMVDRDGISVPYPIVLVRVHSTRAVLGPLMHAFYGSPSLHLTVVGVTGTKGKTTVTWLIRHLLESCGIPCGVMGTIGAMWADRVRTFPHTTPDAGTIQRTLADMVGWGMQACAMEVSSHALDQHRTDGIRWGCAVFTNLDAEHLDYHRTLEAYRDAKRRLFADLMPNAVAILHRGDPSWSFMARGVRGRVVTYAVNQQADLEARNVRLSLHGTYFDLVKDGMRCPVETPLLGLHNVENILAALAVVETFQVPLEWAAHGLATFRGVPGRLERVEAGQPFPIFVDYAHTEGSLRYVLSQLRQMTRRKILTVFGCGGDRDKSKRPRMGRVAALLSDLVIVTSDNPRSEDPAQIAQEILSGMEGLPTPVEVILDRRQAIQAALDYADERWVVLIAGKGHEDKQIFADCAIPFDDREVVRECWGVRRAVGLAV